MTTFRDLTFDELVGRGWRENVPQQFAGGTWVVTLALPDTNGDLVMAVTGQGETAEAARDKATELANRWRRGQAEQRSGEG